MPRSGLNSRLDASWLPHEDKEQGQATRQQGDHANVAGFVQSRWTIAYGQFTYVQYSRLGFDKSKLRFANAMYQPEKVGISLFIILPSVLPLLVTCAVYDCPLQSTAASMMLR